MSKDFDQQKEELLQEVRAVLDDVEELYHSGVEEGSKEAEQLRGKLQRKLQAAQRKLGDFEEVAAERVKQTARQADQLVQDKPYYAMGFAALAGLVVGVLLNRR
ncbi:MULTISPECIES: DUF883 family protein [Eikenella]|jgi:hypothetical protein|uniref:DUF883 family protein n=1 Tax=Eikenella exigua TaxID=2528037 RepID=A0AAX1F9H2_9NEIS|nr:MULTISPECIES: DUF883 family protein [Eikenella]MDU1347558.1 DUF883 family protein [Eikenella corrodens]OAM28244.1 hypothetical protein A7P94_03655 [Eikenella sp. NML01-A-086]OAM42017.1 hypothetical protein A7Q02_04850 [Eikenella sp. NML97-A-109]QED92720.1 DUF883 family protein [Eikenella exigua]